MCRRYNPTNSARRLTRSATLERTFHSSDRSSHASKNWRCSAGSATSARKVCSRYGGAGYSKTSSIAGLSVESRE